MGNDKDLKPIPSEVDNDDSIDNEDNKLEVIPTDNQSVANINVPIGHATDLVVISNELGFAKPLDYLAHMVKHSTNSLSSEGDALMLYQKSRELNIGWTTALENIYLIPTKGGTKTSISVHLAQAMLRMRSDITWELVREYEPIHTLIGKIGDVKVMYNYNDKYPPNHKIVNSPAEFKEVETAGEYIPLMPVIKNGKFIVEDIVTEYKFTRKRIVNGELKVEVVNSKFSINDANRAGLIKPDGNYEKYPELMLDHRAFMNGARKIAGDILLGMYAPAELSDMEEGSTILLDRDGNPIK